MADRRKFHRWKAELTCAYQSEFSEGSGVLLDLSYNGASIRNPSKLPQEGADITLTLEAEETPCEMKAHVVFVREGSPHGHALFGVQFYDSLEGRRKKLLPIFKRYLERD